MTDQELHELFDFVCNHPTDGLSASVQDSLARILISFDSLAFCGQTEEWLSKERYRTVADSLYESASSCDFAGLAVKYRLCKELAFVPYGSKDEECTAIYDSLFSIIGDVMPEADEIRMLECIIYEWGNVISGADEIPDFKMFKSVCRRWLESVSRTSFLWTGLSEVLAVKRIRLLQYYSLRFSSDDSALMTAQIRDAYLARFRNDGPESLDIALAASWYDCLRDAPDCGASLTAASIAQMLSSCLPLFPVSPECGDEHWYMAVSAVLQQHVSDCFESAQTAMFED